ncbi:MAG: ATP-binding protein, partial [Chloroflexi bacterium]|nr:ATP-binding protein [Chloroflexota bacterium]
MMAVSPPPSWQEQNQCYLVAALADLRQVLEGNSATFPASGRERLAELRAPMLAPPAVDTLCARFELSPFEQALLLLCAGVELDSSFATLCARAQGDPARVQPTFSLALGALPQPHWSALAPDSPLRRWRMIEIGAGSSLVASPLRIDEWVLHYLAGVRHLDDRLSALLDLIVPSVTLPPSQQQLAQRVAALWSGGQRASAIPIVQLWGDDPEARREVAAAACAALQIELAVLPSRLVPTDPTELQGLIRLWQRESALSGCALLLDCGEPDAGESGREWVADRFLDSVGGPVLVSTPQRRRNLRRWSVTLEVARPSRGEQADLWSAAVGDLSGSVFVQKLVTHFDLSAPRIQAAAAEALAARRKTGGALDGELWSACQLLTRARLEDLAQRLQPRAGWNDLVLPEAQLATLRQICVQVRQRLTVYETWGFGARPNGGLGITALFAGPSGTGKTMAAELLAGALNLDLYR